MLPSPRLSLLALLCPLLLAAESQAQSNAKHGIDVTLGAMGPISQVGHTGPVGSGVTGIAMSTTSCNSGSAVVPWEAAMDPDHPFIAFLIARERDGRIEQISNLSHVKHAFFALQSSQCTPCQGGSPSGDFLGIGCSDTYSIQNNGNNFWLGPQQEIDPWLGTWDPVCSFFDAGLNPQSGTDCDGLRSYSTQQSNSLGPIGFRVAVQDSDLDKSGDARFFYQSLYVVSTEAEVKRGDNMGHREFDFTVDALGYGLFPVDPMQHGSVLDRWTGATVTSAKNGNDDGRFFVGVRVTGPVDGLYHYEYAVHNRDNYRAGGGLRIPVCAGAQVLNASFRDIDNFGGNDWTFDVQNGELSWSAQEEPLRWNSFYNFSFDSDAAPVAGDLFVDQHFPGTGADFVTVASTLPGSLPNLQTGAGCSANTPPSLFATGAPAQATLGNASFGLESAGNDPGAIAVLVAGIQAGSLDLGNGCTLHMAGSLGTDYWIQGSGLADPSGRVQFALPIPNVPALEGVDLELQLLSNRLAGGPYLGLFDLSNGLRVRAGDSIALCP